MTNKTKQKIDSTLENINFNNNKEEIVYYILNVNYTTYDSCSAYCMDGYDDIGEYKNKDEVRKAVKDYIINNDLEFETRWEDSYSYGHKFYVKGINKNEYNEQIEKLNNHLKKLKSFKEM